MAIIITLIVLAIILVAFVLLRPSIATVKGGSIIILIAIFALPVIVYVYGATTHLETAKQTDFCLSCHAMEPYGDSLKIDDSSYIPANHSQNNLIPSDKACYTCHTNYSMFGEIKVKLSGLKHFFIQYFGNTPEQIELYAPFQNRECLYCHDGARSFVENPLHDAMMTDLKSNAMSCLQCHTNFHDIAHLAEKTLWEWEEKE